MWYWVLVLLLLVILAILLYLYFEPKQEPETEPEPKFVCPDGYHMKDTICVPDIEPSECDGTFKCISNDCVDCKAGKPCKNPSDCCGDMTCNSGFCELISNL